MKQLSLLDVIEPDPVRASSCRAPDFDGSTYEPTHDRARLCRQAQRTFDLMADGAWRTLDEIAGATGDPPASVSARLRDFRKPKFGGHTVERRRRGDAARGLFEYRLVIDREPCP